MTTSMKARLSLGLSQISMMDIRRMLTELYDLSEKQETMIIGLQNEIRNLSKDRPRSGKDLGSDVPTTSVRSRNKD